MTIGIGGLAPFGVNSVFGQSHYPWSADRNVLFALVADKRFENGTGFIGFQTLSLDNVPQIGANFSGPFVVANNWGAKNLGTVETNGAISMKTALAAINQFAAGTNKSYEILTAGLMVSAPGAFHGICGWSDTALPANNLAFQRSDNANPAHYAIVRADNAGVIVANTTTQVLDGGRHVVGYAFDGGAQTETITIDGVVSSVNGAAAAVGNLVATNMVFTIGGTQTGILSQWRMRTVLVYRGLMPAAQRAAYTRFMLAEAA